MGMAHTKPFIILFCGNLSDILWRIVFRKKCTEISLENVQLQSEFRSASVPTLHTGYAPDCDKHPLFYIEKKKNAHFVSHFVYFTFVVLPQFFYVVFISKGEGTGGTGVSQCFSAKKIKDPCFTVFVWQNMAKLTKFAFMLTQESKKFLKLLSFILLQSVVATKFKEWQAQRRCGGRH